MNQNIGISYEATGQDKIISAFEQMARGLDSFMTKIERIDSVLNRVGALFDRLAGKAQHVDAAFGRMAGMERTATTLKGVSRDAAALNAELQATNSLTSKMAAGLNAAVGSVQRFGAAMKQAAVGGPGMPGGPGGPPVGPGSRGRGDAVTPWGMGAYGFMGRWWLAYRGTQAARQGFTDIGMAGAREPLLDPMKDLAAVGFTSKQRTQAEILGQQHIAKYPAIGTLPDYLSAMAEAGSATNVNDPKYRGRGVEQLSRAALAGMKMSAVSQLDPQTGTKLLMSAVHSQLMQMPESQRKVYEGEKYGELAESTAAKIAKIIKVSQIWGTDVKHGLSYALPSALDKGWSLDTLLGYLGTMRTAGYTGQKAGRGLRAIMEAETGKIANLAIAANQGPSGLGWKDYQAASSTDQKKIHGEVLSRIKQRMQTDPFSLFQDMGKWIDVAESRGIDPVQHLKLSRDWVGQMRLTGKGGFVEEWRKSSDDVRRTRDMREPDAALADIQQDPGYLKTRLGNAWTALEQSFGRNHALVTMVDSWVSVMNEITEWNNAGGKIELPAALEKLKDFSVHGVIGGLYDTVNNLLSPLERAVGLLGPNERPATFEETLATVSSLPSKIAEAGKTVGELFGHVERGLSSISNAANGAMNFITGIEQKIDSILPKWVKNQFTPQPKTALPEQVMPNAALPERVMPAPEQSARTVPQMDAEFQLQSYNGGQGLTDAIMQLVSVLGQSEQQPVPQVKVFVGDREIRDIVQEAIADHQMSKRAYMGV